MHLFYLSFQFNVQQFFHFEINSKSNSIVIFKLIQSQTAFILCPKI